MIEPGYRRAEALGYGYEARLRGLDAVIEPGCRRAEALGYGYEARLRGLAGCDPTLRVMLIEYAAPVRFATHGRNTR